ncbi:helix-turn-helix domain-containing protein [Pyruvatibacter mobilis]|uniref:helix-turn-helix domain-containing protein n=1 Tax=Pyruvatibacter mobilis TaxID=1712261 RepID=UPI003C7A411E
MSNTGEEDALSNNTALTGGPLGKYLSSIRKDRGLSLRAVENKTSKQVSNAYLSQIENGKIQQPSPNILHALSDVYKISFESLMEKAGYVTAADQRETKERHGRVATFAEHNLTHEEEVELMQYLEFIRSRNPGS